MRYKKGDRVRLISKPTKYTTAVMGKYLGKVVTISGMDTSIFGTDYYTVEEDDYKRYFEDMIAGLASETPFDFKAWEGKNVCMHCKTREEAEDFCREMDTAGLMWSSGISYLKMKWFSIYENNTCYCFNEGVYGDIKQAKNKGYTILEWSEYRSTEPPKKEQEKIMETKSNDKPLSLQEATSIYKRLCESQRKKESCRECPVSSFKNHTNKVCRDFIINNSDTAEPILKKWAAEHPIKTNMDKLIEVFGEIQKYDGRCKNHCSTIPCQSCNWWLQEYVEPNKEQE